MLSSCDSSTGPLPTMGKVHSAWPAPSNSLATVNPQARKPKAITRIATAVTVAMLLVPAAASAQGNSGADQYREGVPGGGGDTPTGDVDKGGNSGDGNGPSSVSGATERALTTAAGSDGAKLADLTNATAPDRAAKKKHDKKGADTGSQPERGGGGETASGEAAGQSVRSSIGAGPGGLGWGLPALMVLGLVAALAVRIRNRSLQRR
jgi:hypothetical protein